MKYTIQIHGEDETVGLSGGGMTCSPVFTSIGAISEWVRKNVDDKDSISEVTVLRLRADGERTIHGFYDWKGDRLRLNPTKPTFLHNVLYGLITSYPEVL